MAEWRGKLLCVINAHKNQPPHRNHHQNPASQPPLSFDTCAKFSAIRLRPKFNLFFLPETPPADSLNPPANRVLHSPDTDSYIDLCLNCGRMAGISQRRKRRGTEFNVGRWFFLRWPLADIIPRIHDSVLVVLLLRMMRECKKSILVTSHLTVSGSPTIHHHRRHQCSHLLFAVLKRKVSFPFLLLHLPVCLR